MIIHFGYFYDLTSNLNLPLKPNHTTPPPSSLWKSFTNARTVKIMSTHSFPAFLCQLFLCSLTKKYNQKISRGEVSSPKIKHATGISYTLIYFNNNNAIWRDEDPAISSLFKTFVNYLQDIEDNRFRLKQDVRDAYAYFISEQECDRVSVHV